MRCSLHPRAQPAAVLSCPCSLSSARAAPGWRVVSVPLGLQAWGWALHHHAPGTREPLVGVPGQALRSKPSASSKYFVSMAGDVGCMALGTFPVPLANSKTHCALKKHCPFKYVPAGSSTALPGCRRELWGGPGSQQPLWPPRSPWGRCTEHLGRRSKLRPRVLCLSSQGSTAGLWERHPQRGRAVLCSTKVTIRNSLVSRSGWGLHTVLLCV